MRKEGDVYQVFLENQYKRETEEKRLLGRPWRGFDDDVKMYLKK
jgi:hypothetical protein